MSTQHQYQPQKSMIPHSVSLSEFFSSHTLQQTTVGTLIKYKQPAIYINSDSTIEQAARVLEANKILCVPVYNELEKRFVGTVDILALTKYSTLGLLLKEGFIGTFSKDPVSGILRDSREMEFSILEFLPLREEDTIWHAIELFNSTKVHRGFAMKKDDPKNLYVISQSDVVQLINQLPKGTSDVTLRDLQLIKGVVCIGKGDKAFDGFTRIWNNNIHAVAVVDENNKLVDTLSASDLRGMNSHKLQYLLMDVQTYKKMMFGDTKQSLVCCKPNTTLSEAIQLLANSRVHRLWIVDDGGKVVGVVSLTDVLSLVTQSQGVGVQAK